MDKCIFCKIIKGEIPKFLIKETDNVEVILDISKQSEGHCLIIPKAHYKDITQLTDKIILEINEVVIEMIEILEDKLGCTGVEIVTNYGLCQEVKHYHLHLIPVYDCENEKGYIKMKSSELEEVYNKIKKDEEN